jgi:dephospho-CoA kinase
MFVVGLTGGIGSGKTAVSDYLQQQGIEVVDADIVAREVVKPGTSALAAIAQHFGSAMLQADGSLDRAKLRSKIFSDSKAKIWLERLLHPLIGKTINQQLAHAQSPYVLFVSPLLIESGQDAICDRVIVVDVPEALQLERTMARDNNHAEQVQSIITSQASREQRLAKATDVIENSAGLAELEQQAQALHQKLLALAQEHNKE